MDIYHAIKGKSKTTLYWIKVILWIELLINIVSTPFIIVQFQETQQTPALVFFLIVLVIYVAYYVFLIRSINQFNYLSDVKSSLKRLYKYLNFYLLHYKVLIWTIFPGSFLYGMWLGMQESGEEIPTDDQGFWAYIIGVSIICITVMVLLGSWLVNLIYGKKIKRLKGMVQELEEAA